MTNLKMSSLVLVLAATCAGGSITPMPPAIPIWGRLANGGFENQRIKATLFFPGQAKDGTQPYECSAPPNMSLYTVHPADERHLDWAESAENRAFALDRMVSAGINVAVMSSWGEDFLGCTTAWTPWAPMQCSPQAHDELFAAAVGKPIFIMPFIESRADWNFRNEFPRWGKDVAPGTVSQIVNLIRRYLEAAHGRSWSGKWAQVYDRSGRARYAVAIIHASSNNLGSAEHAAYANGFGAIADEVYRQTSVRVGFFIDALPPGTYAPGAFKPYWQTTGPYLKTESSILGVMCFIPEIWKGSSDDDLLINWKRTFSAGWSGTGVPFLMDVSPGYDAHIVFPSSVRYGLNLQWMLALTEMVEDYGADGLVYNSWNGYTEGMAAVVLQEYNDYFYHWLCKLTCTYAPETCRDLVRCGGRLFGDVNEDCTVNLFDLAGLAENWLDSDSPTP